MGDVVQANGSEAESESIEWSTSHHEAFGERRVALTRDGTFLEAFVRVELPEGAENRCGWRMLRYEGNRQREYKGEAQSLDAAQELAETTYWAASANDTEGVGC